MYGLKTESSFDAAHFLTDYHGKCENLHGHRWRVVAYLEQAELQTEGTHKDMVIDFADFKHALRDLTEELDHSFVVEEGSLMPKTLDCLREEGFTQACRAGFPRVAGGCVRNAEQLRDLPRVAKL